MERAYRATIAAPTENESVCGGGCGSRHGAAHLLRLTGLLDYEVAQAMTKECWWGDHAHDRPGATSFARDGHHPAKGSSGLVSIP